MFVGGPEVILDRVEGRASPGRYHLSQELKKVLEGFHAYLTKSTALKECKGPERAGAQHVRDRAMGTWFMQRE